MRWRGPILRTRTQEKIVQVSCVRCTYESLPTEEEKDASFSSKKESAYSRLPAVDTPGIHREASEYHNAHEVGVVRVTHGSERTRADLVHLALGRPGVARQAQLGRKSTEKLYLLAPPSGKLADPISFTMRRGRPAWEFLG
uniref:Uncharacterized protein n=1 Tax=Octactis speculum TaxID=3111310 RepID=A0A7S2B7J1_9STRA|mmetsp:Transcript_20499/g.27817  ORF Transcript_20499/g.27817 Transcript_20499/m.27817 type:complete len:141 (+) Transcript_20499:111-533(+)